METTVLYAELIIIGLETSMWLAMFSIHWGGSQIKDILQYTIEKLPAAIMLLGILYIIGLIFDRIVDVLYDKFEKKQREKSGLAASTSMIVWKKAGQESYFLYSRSRIRILRASTINVPLITIGVLFLLYDYHTDWTNIAILALIIGVFFSCFAIIGYERSVRSFYNRAHQLELDLS